MQLSIDAIATELGEKMPFSLREEGNRILPPDFGLQLEDNVVVDGVAKNIGEGYFELVGNIIATFAGICDLCLGDAEILINVPYTERFLRRNGASVDHIDEETEIYFFSENTMDLTAMVRDNLALNAPLKMLCRADCAGLCPVCGANRSVKPCSREPVKAEEESAPQRENPFAALAQWISDDEEV